MFRVSRVMNFRNWVEVKSLPRNRFLSEIEIHAPTHTHINDLYNIHSINNALHNTHINYTQVVDESVMAKMAFISV